MIHISLIEKMRWAVNAFLIRHTPNRILNKFREGRYLDCSDYCDGTARKKGYLSWRRTERLIERCLDCGLYIKSHQDLNVEPLALTYLETYYLVQKQKEEKDIYYQIYDTDAHEQTNKENIQKLASLVKDSEYYFLNKPMKAYLYLEIVVPTFDEMNKGVEEIAHLAEVTVFAISRFEKDIILHTTDGRRYPSSWFDFPFTETFS